MRALELVRKARRVPAAAVAKEVRRRALSRGTRWGTRQRDRYFPTYSNAKRLLLATALPALERSICVISGRLAANSAPSLPPSAADGMEAYVTDLEKTLIKDSGHWTQQEKPEAVNAVILDWMDRRFPK